MLFRSDWQSAAALLCRLGTLAVQQILGKYQKRDTHKSQGRAALGIRDAFEHARCLQMLRPAQAHGRQAGFLMSILGNPDQREACYNLKH